MLIVTNLSGQTEVVTKYNDFEIYEELNGAYTLSFTSLTHEDNHGHEFIQQESIIEYEDYEFRIKQVNSNTYSKKVIALSTFFDNVDRRKYDTLVTLDTTTKTDTVTCNVSRDWTFQFLGGTIGGTKLCTDSQPCTMIWKWVGNGTSWQPMGQSDNAPATMFYMIDADGYSGNLDKVSSSGTRTAPPVDQPYDGVLATTSSPGTAYYEKVLVIEDTRVYRWVPNDVSRNDAPTMLPYDKDGYKGVLKLVVPLPEPPEPTEIVADGTVVTKTISVTANYSGPATKLFNKTFDEYMNYVLKDTGWTFINEDISQQIYIPDFGDDNVVKLIDRLRETFGCEMKILPNKVLKFATRINIDNDFQYRYGHNIIALSESIDTTKMRTHIEGFGKDGLHVTYTSPLASTPGIGIRHADPVRDDNFLYSEQLLNHIKNELQDYPDSRIELNSVELYERELGESVWVIHERMGIEYQTRVIAKRTKNPKSKSSVVLGNYKPQTITSALASQKVEIEKAKKETKSRIDKTNEQITLEVTRLDGDVLDAKSRLKMTADEIELKVNKDIYETDVNSVKKRLSSAESAITQQADEIALRVSKDVYDIDTDGVKKRLSSAESSITQQASEIALRVTKNDYEVDINGIENRLNSAESSITQTANDLTFKVSSTDYTGAVIASKINQTSKSISMEAVDINLVGAVTVLSDITGNLGTITAGTITGTSFHSDGVNKEVYIDNGYVEIIDSVDGVAGGTQLDAKKLLFDYAPYIGWVSFSPNTGTINLYGSKVSLDSLNGIKISGTVDFSGATVNGLNTTAKFG